MSITIYQIPVTNYMVNEANAGRMTDSMDTKMKLMINAGEKFSPDMFEHYAPSVKVETDDLEEAFALTNLWNDEDRVEHLRPEVASSSVGDLFARDGNFFIVDSFGFKEVGDNESFAYAT